MKYAIKEFRMIPVADLVPHPDALAYPSDEDDRASLDASIEGVGILEPLTVIESAIEWLVIDGCGRLADAEAKKLAELPCLVVECDNPREFAAHKNAMGRKRSTGSRILCYLMANLERVMEAAKMAAESPAVSRDTAGHVANDFPAYLKPWTTKEIARRLSVSNKDVVAALQLVVCQTHGVDPSNEDLDETGRATLDAVFTGVMCARTPVRRWKPAFEGKSKTEGMAVVENPKRHARQTSPRIINMFKNWPSIEWITPLERENVEESLISAMEIMPDFLRAAMVRIILEKWPEHEKQALEKALKARTK